MFSRSNKTGGRNGDPAVPKKPAVPSIISVDLRMVGDLDSEGEIHVDGRVEGDIRTRILLVGETANIKGEVVAESVTVHGTVTGQIKARSVALAKTAHVTGDILHESLAIEKGAYLEGHCKRMDQRKEAIEGRINLVRDAAPALKTAGETKKIATGA